jgi:hypothetical protein
VPPDAGYVNFVVSVGKGVIFCVSDSRLSPSNEYVKFQPNDLGPQVLAVLQKRLEVKHPLITEEVRLLGRLLFDLLFTDKNKAHFLEWFSGNAGRPKVPLRVLLSFEPDAGPLASLPWEFIYVSFPGLADRGFHLASESQLLLARQVSAPSSSLFVNQGPLKVLVVIAEPNGMDDVVPRSGRRDGSEPELISAIRGDKSKNGQIKVEVDWMDKSEARGRASLEAVIAKINTFQPHVLHFAGHGEVDSKGGKLFFADAESGNPQVKSASEVGKGFVALDIGKEPPKLVYLDCCHGAARSEKSESPSIAETLVEYGISSVVAMRNAIPNAVALTLAKTFYAKLAGGERVDAALQAARRALGEQTQPEPEDKNRFGTPIVYFGQMDDKAVYNLVTPPPLKDGGLCDRSTHEGTVACPYSQKSGSGCSGGRVTVGQKECGNCGNEIRWCAVCGRPNFFRDEECFNCEAPLLQRGRVSAATGNPPLNAPARPPQPTDAPGELQPARGAAANESAPQQLVDAPATLNAAADVDPVTRTKLSFSPLDARGGRP